MVLPFTVLELVNRGQYHEGFPVTLFVFLWILPIAFILMMKPILRSPRMGIGLDLKSISLLLQITLLTLFAWLWISLIVDQMPCFLGVPNCD